jgi:hypothetical protein
MLLFAGFSFLLGVFASEPLASQEEIEVSKLPSPAHIFSKYCFDASEKDKKPLEPINSQNWVSLAPQEKTKLNIPQDARSYILQNKYEGTFIILTVSNYIADRKSQPSNTNCSVIYSGDYWEASIRRELTRKFKRPGSTVAIGRQVKSLKGWKQLTWAGNAPRDANNWKVKYSWLWANTPQFYNKTDLFNIQYKASLNSNIKIIELNHYYRLPKQQG